MTNAEIQVGEIWKTIEEYPNYQISNKGRIKSIERITNAGILNVEKVKRNERILKPQTMTKGYLGVKLYNNQIGKTIKIHRLVAKYFIPNPNNYEQVNHIDGNKKNNCVENLEWCNCIQNMEHSYKIGLRDKTILREKMRELAKTRKGVEARWRT